MRPRDAARGRALRNALETYAREVRALPGIIPPRSLDSLVEQIVDSLRRIEYVRFIHARGHDPARQDPSSSLFDPLIAASLAQHSGDIDEGCWLVFLSVHFGKHRIAEWSLTREIYGALRAARPWNWVNVSNDSAGFERWLQANESNLRNAGVVHFGNHRKYESLRVGPSGTASIVRSYIAWVTRHGNHSGLFQAAAAASTGDVGRAFDFLYNSMASVIRFGRMARFDYVAMLGKLELAQVEPAIAYLNGATGPLKGARLLFGGSPNADLSCHTLDPLVAELGARLGVGMQAMEDALCNWQKSPERYARFAG